MNDTVLDVYTRRIVNMATPGDKSNAAMKFNVN